MWGAGNHAAAAALSDAAYSPHEFSHDEFRVMLVQHDAQGLGLGLSIRGGTVFVETLTPGLPAALCQRIEPGDVLLNINSMPVNGVSFEEIQEMLQSPSVFLGFLRDPGARAQENAGILIHDESFLDPYKEQGVLPQETVRPSHGVHEIGDGEAFVVQGNDPDVRAFQAYDTDGTGEIGVAVVPQALRKAKGHAVDQSAVDALVAEMQIAPDGHVTLLEFKHLSTHC